MASIKGFSLRQSLIDNGVTLESSVKGHISFVYACIKGGSRIRVESYRPPVNRPNQLW